MACASQPGSCGRCRTPASSATPFDRILDDGLTHLVRFRNVVPDLQLAVNVEFDTTTETTLLASVDPTPAHPRVARIGTVAGAQRAPDIRPARDRPRRELTAVSDLGVRLMLDDFGTGFASLETLTTLPISGVEAGPQVYRPGDRRRPRAGWW